MENEIEKDDEDNENIEDSISSCEEEEIENNPKIIYY